MISTDLANQLICSFFHFHHEILHHLTQSHSRHPNISYKCPLFYLLTHLQHYMPPCLYPLLPHLQPIHDHLQPVHTSALLPMACHHAPLLQPAFHISINFAPPPHHSLPLCNSHSLYAWKYDSFGSRVRILPSASPTPLPQSFVLLPNTISS